MEKICDSYLEIKKSKFIGILYRVNSVEEVDRIISDLWKEHKKARHICYAYRINSMEKNYADKEPGGTTRGLPHIIHMKNNCLFHIIHSTYFINCSSISCNIQKYTSNECYTKIYNINY